MTTATDHAAIRLGFAATFGRAPSDNEALILHGVARYETGFGRWWKSPEGKASNNLGAIQYKTPKALGLVGPPYPEISPDGLGFLYQDTTPKSDGTSRKYYVYFRRYADLPAGCAALARTVYVINGRSICLAAAARGDVYGFSAAMHKTRYYEGWGATVEKRILNHHAAMLGALRAICRDLGKPLPAVGAIPPHELPRNNTPAPHPTLRRGAPFSLRLHVKALQQALNADGAALVADGKFGPMTESAVREFQTANGLDVDGVVGSLTWAALEA